MQALQLGQCIHLFVEQLVIAPFGIIDAFHLRGPLCEVDFRRGRHAEFSGVDFELHIKGGLPVQSLSIGRRRLSGDAAEYTIELEKGLEAGCRCRFTDSNMNVLEEEFSPIRRACGLNIR